MTMTFHLFRHLLTNQVHNIFNNIDFPSKYNGIGHLLIGDFIGIFWPK